LNQKTEPPNTQSIPASKKPYIHPQRTLSAIAYLVCSDFIASSKTASIDSICTTAKSFFMGGKPKFIIYLITITAYESPNKNTPWDGFGNKGVVSLQSLVIPFDLAEERSQKLPKVSCWSKADYRLPIYA
jgi:hypothetical protein